ncbi:MAG: septum formation initiator family protein [bacterium]|nr:septum formation initiator family protein [bacterium]
MVFFRSKLVLVAALLLAGAFGTLTWRLYHTDQALSEKIALLEQDIREAEEQNRQLSKLVEYFSTPDHLEKEARARFNLKKPDEEVLVIPSPAPLPDPTPSPIVMETKSKFSFDTVADFLRKLLSRSTRTETKANIDEN